uniref:Uncharacterized protein n=1 Tax=Lepeophtheirus salmonis TaxID=72036 RepID=A0A0K2T638_LEPSM
MYDYTPNPFVYFISSSSSPLLSYLVSVLERLHNENHQVEL